MVHVAADARTPALSTAFHTSGPATTWATTAFTLASALATVLAGRLGDLYGRRRVLTIVLGTGSAGLALAAAADTLTALVIGRTLAGIGTAALPLAFALVRSLESPERASAAISLLSTVTGLGAAGGWVLGGPLISLGGPAALSLLPLALSVPALAGVRFTVPPDLPPARAGDRSLDLAGAIGLALWLTALLLSCAQGGRWGWTSPAVLGLSAAGLLGAAAWARHELRCRHPLIDLRAHCSPALLTAGLSRYVPYRAGTARPLPASMSCLRNLGTAVGSELTAVILLPDTPAAMTAAFALPCAVTALTTAALLVRTRGQGAQPK
ncbi:MFS transporter [Streptomyces tritici]|uniref:MFS transporter n=1 Tax=Streptomyces tritici TaxID=2054410 RepID=UPI003AF06DA5